MLPDTGYLSWLLYINDLFVQARVKMSSLRISSYTKALHYPILQTRIPLVCYNGIFKCNSRKSGHVYNVCIGVFAVRVLQSST